MKTGKIMKVKVFTNLKYDVYRGAVSTYTDSGLVDTKMCSGYCGTFDEAIEEAKHLMSKLRKL